MSDRYLTVYNLALEKEWVLKNPFDIIETKEINTVYTLDFSIPMDELDMSHLRPYFYVRYGDDGELYRITENSVTKSSESTVTYHCEHVIATLSDEVMFQGPYIKGGVGHYTTEVINFILNKQPLKNGVRNWKLGVCQPQRQFEYSWENENLLAALWSIPTCFATPYMWTFDTTSYPWTLNLVNINQDADPNFYMMAKKNILRSEESSTNLEICTRLYGLGEGEGVNQLTIKSVNNGLPYIQSSAEKIAEYGIVSRIFVDRRFQSPETLKARMETLLAELENPQMKRTFEIVDLYDMSPDDMYKAEVGNIVLLKDDNTKVYITKTRKNWSAIGDMQITIATKATDISSSIADLADRQRIEQVYSQGASQVYSFSFFGNATPDYPLNGYVYFPDDLKYLNEVKLKVNLDPFRSYSKSESAYFDGGNIYTETDGGTKNISTTGNDGGVTNVSTTGNDGGVNSVSTTGNDGGVSNVSTTGNDGGVSGLQTLEGGKVDTVSGEGGAQEGETSVASGGGGISLSGVNVTANLDIEKTDDADWERTPYTQNKDLDIKVTSNQGEHQHYIDGRVASVEPLPQYNYKHTHYFSENGSKTAYTEYGGGKHSHEAYVDNGEESGHYHDIPRWTLKHTHKLGGTVTGSIDVNNNEGGGQTGFSHSHNFKIKAHTHHFTSPNHKHTFGTPNHKHTFSTPNHKHTFSTPNHKHTFDTPNHKHQIPIGKHDHAIEAGIFTSGNPKNFQITVGDNVLTASGTNVEMNITNALLKDGKVPRGQWIKISVKPDDLAYISVFGNTFAFIQSYTGGNY